MNNHYAVTTSNLTKYYGRIRGIDGVNLEVLQGEVFGFLGPNGAGKTTTIRILLDMIRPTRGSAQVFGLDVRRNSVQIRRRLGNLPGDVALYDTLKGGEVLKLLGSFSGVQKLSLFYYYRPMDIIAQGNFTISSLVVYLGITVACFTAALVVFQRRKAVV